MVSKILSSVIHRPDPYPEIAQAYSHYQTCLERRVLDQCWHARSKVCDAYRNVIQTLSFGEKFNFDEVLRLRKERVSRMDEALKQQEEMSMRKWQLFQVVRSNRMIAVLTQNFLDDESRVNLSHTCQLERNQGRRYVNALERITSAYLPDLDASALRNFIEDCPDLTSLTVKTEQIDGDLLSTLEHLPLFTKLHIPLLFNRYEMQELRRFPSLSGLLTSIQMELVNDEEMPDFTGIHAKLTSLDCWLSSKVSPECFTKSLRTAPQLKDLTVRAYERVGVNVRGCFPVIAQLTSLRLRGVNWEKGQFGMFIPHGICLERIVLEGNRGLPKNLYAYFGRLPGLKELSLINCDGLDKGSALTIIQHCPKLTKFTLRSTSITKEDFAQMQEAFPFLSNDEEQWTSALIAKM